MFFDKRVLLVVKRGQLPDGALHRLTANYQAINEIKHIEEVEPTWALNKVPLLVLEADLSAMSEEISKYEVIEIPESVALSDLNDDFVEFCHSNGVESGEYITGQKHYGGTHDCFLCRIARGLGPWREKRAEYNATTTRESDVVMYETDNFFWKIELGCLFHGMTMVCTKEHIMSTASLPDDQMQEYEQILEDVNFLLKEVYGDGPVIFFEHGSAPDGGSSHKRSIVHHHTHVAYGVTLDQEDRDRVSMRPIKDIREVRGKKYLSYQEGPNGQLWVADNPEVFVARQYPRKVIGFKLGISYEQTNWRVEPFAENMTKTFHDIHAYLTKNWEVLPERIKEATKAFYLGYPKRPEY